ncbi:MAG: hypothetical protein H6510_03795 [Acidobacteria bacterium]|nr:hypothetical protein [Acidobacteriota bacterium]MCB9396917.1 hypothetical protein [Acidobacteriota bacterium]
MFREILVEISDRVPGIENVFLAGTDGIVVAKLKEGPMDELLIVEATTLLNECNRLGTELGSGAINQFTFCFRDRHLVLQMVNEEYFLLGTHTDPTEIGKLKYLLKIKSLECYVNVT